MEIINYTDKSFVLYGEDTRKYKEQIKSLGGRFNSRLKERDGFDGGAGWIFPVNKKDAVEDLISQAKNINNNGDENSLPTVVMIPKTKTKYQHVKWKVYKPNDDDQVVIKVGGKEINTKVIQTEQNNNVTDTAYIDCEGKISKLVICNGKWQVWGYTVEHTVFFSSSSD